MFVHYFLNYFLRLRTNHYTLFTISPISVIFNSARNLTRNLPYCPLWHFVKIPIVWRERWNARWEKWLARWFTKCHLHTSHFSRFANIFPHSRQFDDTCIVGLWPEWPLHCSVLQSVTKSMLSQHTALNEHVVSHVPIERGRKRVILHSVQRAVSTSIWFVFGERFLSIQYDVRWYYYGNTKKIGIMDVSWSKLSKLCIEGEIMGQISHKTGHTKDRPCGTL